MQTTESYMAQLNMNQRIQDGLRQALIVLSLFVTIGVFWGLKLTGITMAGEAFCGLDEHVHGEVCGLPELICEIEESDPHVHDETCLIRTLQCELEEQENHIHEESCYLVEEGGYLCGLEESEGHTHDDACYQAAEPCTMEEHIHVESCYSDLSADLETSDDWEKTLEGLDLTDNRAENMVLIARSQLGYTESTANFQVDEQLVRRGITRYGQWYGNPYGDWSAMFVGFCLRYSGAEDMPVNAGPEAMRLEWEEAQLYGNAADFLPAGGYLLFLDKDENGTADAVAIICGVADGMISAIEGDLQDAVAETAYPENDPAIMGYGRIATAPQLQFQPSEGATLIAQTESDEATLFVDGSHLVIYVEDETGCYVLDGNGAFFPVGIDENGDMYAETEDPQQLIWVVSESENGIEIFNLVTQMRLPEGGINPLAMTDLDDEPVAGSTGGNYQYARAATYKVWLDGTMGGLMSYGDASNTSYSITGGTQFTLPTTWNSTSEYGYVVQGWYDVTNNKYYEAGTKITVNGNMVFYPDWIAATYDIGQFNAQVAHTVSTNEFVTTRMFDYNALFNVLSSSADVSFSNNGHTETWKLITNGKSPYSGENTLNYIFRDWDEGSKDITYPNGVGNNSPHYPTDTGTVYSGLYNDQLATLLFDPQTDVIGKLYLGTADHLFQLCTDPNDANYGYYYYDSERNAASYNQSQQRFYVYDYLEQTTVSATTDGLGKYSDFLPLNSPYANTQGKAPTTYTYNGKYGEYNGTSHYMFDGTNSNNSNVAANFFYGMSSEIQFYLPNKPGSGGNMDVYGKEMHFKFSGDDDVWVLVDGQMVLDLGGIHGMESGDINFSTGIVTINGTPNTAFTNTVKSFGAGEHTLTLYYLERGSSMANCAIYFNLAPRFSFSIQKEDVLTKDVLNGAQFSVYTDRACTEDAQLWTSKVSYDQGDPATNVFTVVDGVANMWGMGSGNTYYIKETRPPDAAEYTYASGIICLTIDKQGQATYSVELIGEGNAGISNGFMVHGFRIDEQIQQAYIVATNAPSWVKETTSVWVAKQWQDSQDHSGETVTAYLTVTDPDGTVRRLQEAQLGSANNWKHQWTNLPKYAEDGVTPIQYSVEEAYVSGYYSKVEPVDAFATTTTIWSETTKFENGKTYILKTSNGCLSTLNRDSDTGYQWVTEETAKTSDLALWTATTNGNKVRLTNGANQTISFYYGNGNPTDFFAATSTDESNNVKRYFNYTVSGKNIRLYYDTNNTDYYLTANRNSSNKFSYATNANSAVQITLMTQTVTTTTEQVEGWAYQITNIPLEQETSVTVHKAWDYGYSTATSLHEQAQVTIELLANGKETGRTVTVNLKSNWNATFRGLPYTDDSGNVIAYSVVERWESSDWIPYYGEIVSSGGSTPTYSITVTNAYRWGRGDILPSTGSAAHLMCVLLGGGIMLASVVYGIATRRKRERRRRWTF